MIYSFLMTVVVTDQDGDGVYVACADPTDTYGAGESPELALIDFFASFAESWQSLVDDQDMLGAALKHELCALRSRVQEVRQ
jgi:hypothetical protein